MKFRLPAFRFVRGLSFRYSLFFLLSFILTLFIPIIVGVVASMALLVLSAQKETTVMTDQMVISIENALLPTELVPRTLVQALENPNISFQDIKRIAADFVTNDPTVFGTCLAFEPFFHNPGAYWNASYLSEKDGKLHPRSLGGEHYDYFKMDWYRLPKLLGRPVWTEPYFDAGGGDTLMCTYSIPFYSNHGEIRKFAGVLTMDVSLAQFDQMVKKVSVFETGYGFLVSREGQIISAPVKELENRNIIDVVVAGKGKKSLEKIRSMLEGEKDFTDLDGLGAKKHRSYISYAPVGKTGWSLGVVFPEKELFGDMLKFLKFMGWMWGICILLLLLTTIWITRRLTRPIVRLVEATKKVGQGDFNAELPKRKSKDEVAQLTNAFRRMQEELRSYISNLAETTSAKEKIESELKVAQQIQVGMLPRGFKTPGNWEIFATLEAAKAVGGDLYDYFNTDENHMCIAIGDVAGKGVPASLFMMVTRTLLRAKAKPGQKPGELMASINAELCQDNPNEMFVTFFIGIVNLTSGAMEFCNAGHNYPYIIESSGAVRQLKVRNGIPLGIFSDTPYETSGYSFRPNEILVVTTDGITDALSSSNDFYGEAQLTAALASLAHTDTRSLTELLIAEVKRFSSGAEQADDITILTLQYKDKQFNPDPKMKSDSLHLKNEVTELEKIALKLEELSETWNLPPRVVMEINLALEELFSNVVFYAFSDGQEHLIRVDFTMPDPETIRLTIEDDGQPFNLLAKPDTDTIDLPLDERPIGGLGIHLVKEMMTNVEYRRENGHNIVTLTRKF